MTLEVSSCYIVTTLEHASRTLWIPASAGMTNSRQAAGNKP
ncbi:hypothetical protein MELA_02307 [Candidatus Methylomirabilis lanthanidiphila]|uniref:Uncharacterized protein n=1 Tax=Candidatus Methylomirabilis lanthanidiphila TaxID=2211376 RepID=A0A564ZKQ8_9BACT|nr:hypothetical protein MELA_02307 [Candidatus Methylomirabilis lanthanidiphila]